MLSRAVHARNSAEFSESMNKIYKSVWCEATGTWVATSETARSKTKCGTARKLAIAQAVLAGAALMGGVSVAHAQSTAATYYFAADPSTPGLTQNAQATAAGTVAAGGGALASGQSSAAIGDGAKAMDIGAVALGTTALASQRGATAIGFSTVASGVSSTANGSAAWATADYSTALGGLSNALEQGATALGASSTAMGTNAVALGYGATASTANSVALGANSTTTANLNAAAVVPTGAGATPVAATTATGEVSVGSADNERRVTNVAAGAAPTDAVNVSQLSAVDGKVNTLAQSGTLRYFKADGAGDDSDDAAANGTHSVAAGANASATQTNSVAVGYNASSTDRSSTALGANSVADASVATAVGAGAEATGAAATAIGANSSATALGSVALGNMAEASADGSVALGQGSSAAAAGSVALGQGSVADRANTVSVGSAGSERQITNVAAGTADTDAVNVAQLKAVSDQSAATAAKLDGAVMYDQNADGTVNKNSVTLGGDAGTAIHNVADGVDASDAVNLGQLNAAINGAVSNITVNTANPFFSAEGDRDTEGAVATGTHSVASGANAQATGTNAVAIGANSIASGNNTTALGAAANASADNAVALGQGSVADRANTVSVGAAGAERQITNVAAGVQGTDAVNVNQLQQSMNGAVGQANSYTNDQIRSARRDAYGGTATALAAAGLPQAVLPGHGMVAMAAGTYGGQSAIAIGVSQLSETGKWVYKVQGTSDSRGQFGASVGAGMHW
jgi:autotransporter adhesin